MNIVGDSILSVFEAILKILPFRMIHEYEQGIRWTFGHPGKVSHGGILWFVPLFQRIDIIDITVGAISLTSTPVITNDKKSISIIGGIEYQVIDGRRLLLCLGDNDIDEIVGVLAKSSIEHFINEYNLENLRNNISSFEDDLTELLNDEVQEYGINVIMFHITGLTETININLLQ